MRPAPLFDAGIVVVGTVEVADERADPVRPEDLIDHLLIPSSTQEIPLGRGTKGPDVAIDPVFAPTGLIASHDRALLDGRSDVLDRHLRALGNLLGDRDEFP